MSNVNWDEFLSYSLCTKEDLDKIIKDHESFLIEVGLPFFELTDTIHGIDIFLNKKILELDISEFKMWEEQEKKNLLNNIGFKGVVASLITSYLNSKNNFDLLALKFREFYSENPFVINYLEKTVTALKEFDHPT